MDTYLGPFEQDYLSEDYFIFTIDNENITEFSLYLPQRFDFALPPGYDSSRQGLLEILFNDILLANITIVVEEGKYKRIANSYCDNFVYLLSCLAPDNTLTIILIVFLFLLFILLCVVVVITIVFAVMYCKKKKHAKK